MTDQLSYRCPLCKLDLISKGRSLICANNHCFDIAKEGYVNLLPVQKKKSIAPGDNAAMIQARRRFFEAGYYDDFAKFLVQHIKNEGAPQFLLDIGCGEGYYSKQISENNADTRIYGVDISKPAVKACAKKLPNAHYSVASAFDLPFFEGQFDTIVSVFSPINMAEADRVLKADGVIYKVGPGSNHLRALASHVYKHAHEHQGNKNIDIPDRLTLVTSTSYEERVVIDSSHLLDLLHMTPYYWSCSEENKANISKLAELEVELDFEIQLYQKQP